MTHTPRRDVLKAAGAVAVVGGLAGCGQQDGGTENETETQAEATGETQETGAYRVAHMSPDAPNIDVFVDEEVVIEGLGFREVSPYQELEPGTHRVQITATGDPETVVFDEEIDVEAGVANTAVAYGEAAGGPDAGFTVDVLEDEPTDPGEGTSRLRLFHASPDAGEVNVVVTQPPEGGQQPEGNQTQDGAQGNQTQNGAQGNQTRDGQPSDLPQQGAVLFERVEFGESVAQEIPAGEYSLGVVPAGDADQQPESDQQPGNETALIQQGQQGQQQPDGDQSTQPPVAEFDLSAESQTVYSAFATGYVSPEAAPVDEAFEVVTVVDAEGGERAEGDQRTMPARVVANDI